MRTVVAFGFCKVRAGKNVADGVVSLDVSNRVRPRRAAYGRLIDEDDVVDEVSAFDVFEKSDSRIPLTAFFLKPGIQNIVHQCRLARTRHARDTDDHIERYLN